MMSEDARLREIAFARERYLRDQRQIEKEYKRALKRQYEAGYTEGIAAERTKVIAEMLKLNMNENIIQQVTECTQEMIEEIKKSLV